MLLALEEDEFAVKKSRFRVRLNSEKDGRWIGSFTFYEEPVAETLRLPWWLQCVLMSINGKMKRRSGFGIIIAKTRGMCYRHKLIGLINGPRVSWA